VLEIRRARIVGEFLENLAIEGQHGFDEWPLRP